MRALTFIVLCIIAICSVFYVPRRVFESPYSPSWEGHYETQIEPSEIKEAVNAKKFKDSPLYKAIMSGDTDRIVTFLNAGAKLDQKEFIESAEEQIYDFGRIDRATLSAMIDHGLDPKNPDVGRFLLSRYASRMGSEETLRYLIKKGADVRTGKVLESAVRSNDPRNVKVLLEFKADPNDYSSPLDSPLHAAVRLNNAEMVRMLVKAGANIHAKDWQGHTPLDLAGDIRSLLNNKEEK